MLCFLGALFQVQYGNIHYGELEYLNQFFQILLSFETATVCFSPLSLRWRLNENTGYAAF